MSTTEAEDKKETPNEQTAPVAEQENQMATLQGDLERFKELALRTAADFENFRKRAIREKEEAIKYANTAFFERLVPIMDNFELGLQAARQAENSAVVQGIEMVAKQLSDFLSENGLSAIQAEGERFDPNLHEAVAQEAHPEIAEGIVIRQLRKGYKLKDRLLRPSNVVVSKGQE